MESHARMVFTSTPRLFETVVYKVVFPDCRGPVIQMTGIVSADLSITSSISLRIILCKYGIEFHIYINYLKTPK